MLAPYYLTTENCLARVERLSQPETKTTFGNESHFFFSSGVSSGRASGSAHG
jgi:hypothetical protein